MKTKTIKIYVPLLFTSLILLLIGCKDYLDLKGNNTHAVPTTLDHLQALLNDARMIQELTPSMVENWADDYFVLPANYERLQESFQRIYIWELEVYDHPNDWSKAYQPIYNANFCLEGLSKIARDQDNHAKYDRIWGEALFYRAYYFHQLVWAFAPAYDSTTAAHDLGIVLKEDTDFNTPSVRSSVQACYDKIIRDTEEAIPLLGNLPMVPTQPSKASAHALLARLYLSMRLYEKAHLHADEALKLKNDLMDYNNPRDGVFLTRSQSFDRYNKETIFYSEMNSVKGGLYLGNRGGRIDTLLVQQYDDADLRRKAFLQASQDYFQFKGSYANNRHFSGLATNEVMLIKAEAEIRLGDVEEGIETLNHLMRFRYDNTVPFYPLEASDRETALDIVLKERRKELLMRGLRFMDIKRLNKEGANISITRMVNGNKYVLEPSDERFVVPLPTDLIPFVN